jgi:Undecaprenyl-phosphate glucose phosphotransferase
LRDQRYSRGVLLLWVTFAFLGIATVRIVSRTVLHRLRARGYNLRHVMVVGSGVLAQRVLQILEQQVVFGFRIKGVVVHERDRAMLGDHLGTTPILGTIRQLPQLLKNHAIDQVIVALPMSQLGALKRLMRLLSRETVDVRLVPDVNQYMTLCGSVEEFRGLPIINLQSSPLLGWDMVTKRLFDIIMASLLVVVFSPVFAIVALVLALSEGRPIFFKQMRVGLDGRKFSMFKFRSMRPDSEKAGACWTLPNDPRRTALGAFLRKYSLDELPQLFNVLKGDMSLVGPRPEQPRFIEQFRREIPRYALRHKIKAGMTGWAQINGLRGNTSIQERIELDLYYIENWSLLLDIKILLRTLLGGFVSPNAY